MAVERVKTWVLLFVAAVVLAIATYPITTQMPAGLVPDDGYFYAKIASNIAGKHFSSFDGINPTDGYHQLWQYLLAAVAVPVQAATSSKTVLLISFLSLDFFLLLGTALLAGRTWIERVFIILSLGCCEFLMEGRLLAFLIAALVFFLAHEKKWAALVCCGLIPLTRIDATLVPSAIGVAVLWGGNRKLGGVLLAATVSGAIIHFALMLGLHGHLLSVSSQIKSGGASSGIKIFGNLGQRTPTLPLPFEPQGIVAIILGASSLVAVTRLDRGIYRTNLTGLWVGVALFTLGHLCFSDVHPWYYAPAYIGFPLVIIESQEGKKMGRILVSGVVLTTLLFTAFLVKAVKNRGEVASVKEFVAETNRVVPQGESIYAVDGSGFLGYWSDAPVVNGDGLVNSHEYAARLKANRLAGYVRENHIHYLITNKNLAPTDPFVDIGGLWIDRSEAQAVVTKADNGHYFFTNFVLWKLKN